MILLPHQLHSVSVGVIPCAALSFEMERIG